MDLAIVTPTRKRWQWIAKQAKALAPQLKPDDRWIIVIDNDQTPAEIIEPINKLIGLERLAWCLLSYYRPDPPVGRVNVAHNVGATLASREHAIVELDDHDIIEPGALDAIRKKLDDGAEYVFGWYKQEAVIQAPNGKQYIEPWPHVRPIYEPLAFTNGTMGDGGAGLRAIARPLWETLGGWDETVWPAGDRDLAKRAEFEGANIACLPQFLCTVTIDPNGISAMYQARNSLEIAT